MREKRQDLLAASFHRTRVVPLAAAGVPKRGKPMAKQSWRHPRRLPPRPGVAAWKQSPRFPSGWLKCCSCSLVCVNFETYSIERPHHTTLCVLQAQTSTRDGHLGPSAFDMPSQAGIAPPVAMIGAPLQATRRCRTRGLLQYLKLCRLGTAGGAGGDGFRREEIKFGDLAGLAVGGAAEGEAGWKQRGPRGAQHGQERTSIAQGGVASLTQTPASFPCCPGPGPWQLPAPGHCAEICVLVAATELSRSVPSISYLRSITVSNPSQLPCTAGIFGIRVPLDLEKPNNPWLLPPRILLWHGPCARLLHVCMEAWAFGTNSVCTLPSFASRASP
jgi:hypothetical protein